MNALDALIEARAAAAIAEIRAMCETARRSIGQRTRRATPRIPAGAPDMEYPMYVRMPLPKVRGR